MAAAKQLPTMVLGPSFWNDGRDVLVEDAPLVGEPTLVLYAFLVENENWVDGKTMLRRGKAKAKELGPLAGRHHAKSLLAEQKDEIPVEWRAFHLVFPGSKWQDESGRQWVAGLRWRWHPDEWEGFYYCLDNRKWSAADRLVHAVQVP